MNSCIDREFGPLGLWDFTVPYLFSSDNTVICRISSTGFENYFAACTKSFAYLWMEKQCSKFCEVLEIRLMTVCKAVLPHNACLFSFGWSVRGIGQSAPMDVVL